MFLLITGSIYDRYVTARGKKLAQKCAKLERFKVKWQKFARNLYIAESPESWTISTKVSLMGPILEKERHNLFFK